MRREHPRWGARRICYELGLQGVGRVPARATVHRVLARNGMISGQLQHHRRRYRRWQRQAPMHLWQLDIVGGVPLADGRECKLLTGIDDHSRYVVVAGVLIVPSGRAVCEAFTAAMRCYGVPSEVLTDNGAQFTGRHAKPQPVEVLFERICRENGIMQRRTKPRSPTTTGKIERFHKTLREELLDSVAPFESLAVAQQAIDGWVSSYNHHRPHQSLDMATPASLFRPNGPTRLDVDIDETDSSPTLIDVITAPPTPSDDGAVELEVRVPPSGEITLANGRQKVSLRACIGRLVTIWADYRTLHISLEGQLVRTVPSRLLPEHLQLLRMRGARPAGPAPAAPALRKANGRLVVAAGQAIEIDRIVNKDGAVTIAGHHHVVGFGWVGHTITLRLDGHSSTASPRVLSSVPGPAPSATTSSVGSEVPAPRQQHCHHRPYRRARCAPNAAFTNPDASLSLASASNSDRDTAASSSPSSSKTPTYASYTATKKSPCVRAAAPSRLPVSTSPPKEPRPRNRQASPEDNWSTMS
jgi:transposase InsO family protein